MTGKLTKWVLIAAAAALTLGILYAVLLNQPAKTDEGMIVFVDRQPAQIQTLSIENEYGAYDVTSTPEGYTLSDIPATIVDTNGFYELMNHGCGIGALKKIAAQPESLSLYGLDTPQATVRVSFTDGETHRLRIGAQERVSGNYYGQIDDDEAVYLFSGDHMVYYLCRKEAYISRQITPALAVSSPLSAIKDVTFSGTSLEKPITVEAVSDSNPEAKLLAKSFGPATHIVRMKGVYELDQTYGVTMLGSLLGITALDVVGYNLSDKDLSKLGFDEPYMKVAFGLKNGTDYIADYELSLVQAKEVYLAHLTGTGVVYLIEKPDFVDIDYTKLCLRWFLAPLRLDLASTVVSFDGKTYVYESGKNSDGTQYATVNGQTMDMEQFYSFFRLITSAASDGQYLTDVPPGDAPLMTITYTYLDAQKAPDVMKLCSGATRRVNVEVNGITEFDMKSSFVDAVKTACTQTLSGGHIEENW